MASIGMDSTALGELSKEFPTKIVEPQYPLRGVISKAKFSKRDNMQMCIKNSFQITRLTQSKSVKP